MNKQGFTLIELLLYVGIAATILSVLASSVFFFLGSRERMQTISEMQNDSMRVVEFISRDIRGAEAVLSPAPGSDATSLTLDSADAGETPIEYFVEQNRVVRETGTGERVYLTSDDVEIQSLGVSNLSRDNTPDIIQLEMDVAYRNPNNRAEYLYATQVEFSASTRNYEQ